MFNKVETLFQTTCILLACNIFIHVFVSIVSQSKGESNEVGEMYAPTVPFHKLLPVGQDYNLYFHLLNTVWFRPFSLAVKGIWTCSPWHFSNFIQTLKRNLAGSGQFSMTRLLIFKEEVL